MTLAPSRPRKDDTKSYCIPCSERTGRLVRRVCPAKTNAKLKRVEAQRRRQEERKQQALLKAQQEQAFLQRATTW